LASIGLVALSVAIAQNAPTPQPDHPVQQFVRAGTAAIIVTRPENGPKPHVAVLYQNGSGFHPMCTELAKRGFVTACILENNSAPWTNQALAFKAAIEYLKQHEGITKILLYGHSGGGSTASFYQAVAENGVSWCQGAEKIWKCGNELANLPPADGMLFPDAHPGLSVMDLEMVVPGIHSDGNNVTVDPLLDYYNPANGYNPNGPSHYTDAFKARYLKAKSEESNRLVAEAQEHLAALKSGTANDPALRNISMRMATVMGVFRLDELDAKGNSYSTATRQPRRLLKDDGSIAVEEIRTVAVAGGLSYPTPARPAEIPVLVQSIELFLSRAAMWSTSLTYDGMDYCSALSTTVCNTRYIHVPTLFIPSGAGIGIGTEEQMFDESPAKDKEYIVVEGASHGGAPCKECEKVPGQYAHSQEHLYDYIAAWINKRF
jgi:hypothetical protein